VKGVELADRGEGGFGRTEDREDRVLCTSCVIQISKTTRREIGRGIQYPGVSYDDWRERRLDSSLLGGCVLR
jgi:hypothetical protein